MLRRLRSRALRATSGKQAGSPPDAATSRETSFRRKDVRSEWTVRPPSVAFLTYFTYFTLYSTSHHREKSAQPRETEADEHGYDKKTHHIDYF